MISQFCSLEIENRIQWAKIKVLTGLHFILEALKENLFSCPSLHREVVCNPLLVDTFFIAKVCNSKSQSFQHEITLTSSTSLFQFIDTYDCIGSTQII